MKVKLNIINIYIYIYIYIYLYIESLYNAIFKYHIKTKLINGNEIIRLRLYFIRKTPKNNVEVIA